MYYLAELYLGGMPYECICRNLRGNSPVFVIRNSEDDNFYFKTNKTGLVSFIMDNTVYGVADNDKYFKVSKLDVLALDYITDVQITGVGGYIEQNMIKEKRWVNQNNTSFEIDRLSTGDLICTFYPYYGSYQHNSFIQILGDFMGMPINSLLSCMYAGYPELRNKGELTILFPNKDNTGFVKVEASVTRDYYKWLCSIGVLSTDANKKGMIYRME
jgi:hypothetical protein